MITNSNIWLGMFFGGQQNHIKNLLDGKSRLATIRGYLNWDYNIYNFENYENFIEGVIK